MIEATAAAAPRPVQSQAARPNPHGMPLRRRRRKPIPTPPGHPSDSELVASYLNSNAITKCKPGWAIGSLRSTSLGLEG